MNRVRVLVVDDSATMRSLISASLRRDPELDVVGTASDPLQAREAIKALNPDVLTLDVEMPEMSGILFLEKIMRLRPMPVVMVSSLTQRGAETALEALELGAVDCFGKPQGGVAADSFRELAAMVKAAGRGRVRPWGERKAGLERHNFTSNGNVVAMGSSTGGVEALVTVLTSFPKNCPPTVITQHMPANFTRSFAERLNRICPPEVCEATDGARLEPGRVYIAPGGSHHLKIAQAGALVCRLVEADPVSGHRPSVDVLFQSVADAAGSRAVGAILTGMGSDGANGLLAMREAGARTFGQNEASCVVYGMPKAARALGAVEQEVPVSDLATVILDQCETRARPI